MKYLLLVSSFLLFAAGTKAQTDSVWVVSKGTRAAERADSVAKAELKKYQQEHPRRLTKAQLRLETYDRNLHPAFNGKNDYYLFDYDYNLPLGGLVYMLHFSVMIDMRTGRTVFKPQE